jgi:hypothetical protein
LVAGSSGWFEHAAFAHALAGEFDLVGIVNDAVEDGVGEVRISDDVVPAIDRIPAVRAAGDSWPAFGGSAATSG